ncbi:hypothetical protein DDR33_17170 [Pararcticibacter amylolyticus]|uniref:Uncharacterized protein n=1 Tax=Pararcticibacter amylolyticus TaxID=2173175 RepID=A0A2U2PDM3_9SPHI|nr:hypothetical protein DDR33_17170 [Pararcticibacter amylolyticus]
MGQIFTVNLAGSSFHFQLIKLQQIDRVVESQILLQGTTVTLCKETRGDWKQKESSNPLIKELVQAIGNSISLRYRI